MPSDSDEKKRSHRRTVKTVAHATWKVIKQTVNEFDIDEGFRLAAAIAFYGVLSLAPLVVVLAKLAGWIWGEEAARRALLMQVHDLVGTQGAEVARGILETASSASASWMPTWVSFLVLLVSASLIVVQFQKSLNVLWDVKPRKTGILPMLLNRLFGLVVLVLSSFLLAVTVLFSALMNFVLANVADAVTGPDWMWRVASSIVSIVALIPIFAALYKFIPNVRISWRDVGFGSSITAILFVLGKELITFYLGQSSTIELYGPAGSLFFLLIWFYYSAVIVFFGAEITQVRANRYGDSLEPDRHAVWADLKRRRMAAKAEKTEADETTLEEAEPNAATGSAATDNAATDNAATMRQASSRNESRRSG